MVEETFDTREQAQAVWTSAETQAAMEADGMDMASMWVEYFDEVGLGELPLENLLGRVLDFDSEPRKRLSPSHDRSSACITGRRSILPVSVPRFVLCGQAARTTTSRAAHPHPRASSR